MENEWIEKGSSLYDIKNEDKTVKVSWSKNYSRDLIELSEKYYKAAMVISIEITSKDGKDNIKTDMWFLPAVYLFRQSIELLVKGLIARLENHNPKIQAIFKTKKHNLLELFKCMKSYIKYTKLTIAENLWVEKYLENVEKIDKNSDLFRYPFSDEFMNEYGNKFLDVVDILNRLIQCYSLIYKELSEKYYKENEFDAFEEPLFFSFSPHGIGNCYIWDSKLEDGFHKQIIGYSEAGSFLYSKCDGGNNAIYLYPMLFIFRNAIEIALKRLLFSRTRVCVDNIIVNRKKKTHRLKKDLWKYIRPVLIHYAEEKRHDLDQIDIAESYINQIKLLDKNGDTFRYPFTYSFEYKLNNKEIDLENAHKFMKSIFNFLDCCSTMLGEIRDFESEMSSYY
jgi:HEPN domain-containing protein